MTFRNRIGPFYGCLKEGGREGAEVSGLKGERANRNPHNPAVGPAEPAYSTRIYSTPELNRSGWLARWLDSTH